MSAVPELRFPDFNDELKTKKFGNLLDITSASRVHKDEWTKFGIPFFRSSDVVSHFKGLSNRKAYISQELFDELSKKKGSPKKGDLLVTGGGSIGIPFLVETNAPLYFKDADLLWFRGKEQVSSQFLYAFLQTPTFRKYLTQITHIGTIAHYTVEQAKATPVVVPTLPEQKKIAGFLSAVDDKLAAVEAKLAVWSDYKRGMMQALFSQSLRFKADDGSGFPDWKKVELGEMLDYEQPTKYLVSSTDYDAAFKTPVLTAGKSFILGYTDEVDGIYEKGPVIIFDDFTTASKFVDFRFKAKSSAMKMLSAKEGNNIKFLYEAMQMIRYPLGEHKRHWISEFAIYPISVPSLPEQQKIADALSAIDRKIDALTGRLEATREFKRGLLQKMFV